MLLFISIFIIFLLLAAFRAIAAHDQTQSFTRSPVGIQLEAIHLDQSESDQIKHLKFNQIRLKPIKKGPNKDFTCPISVLGHHHRLPTVIKGNLPAFKLPMLPWPGRTNYNNPDEKFGGSHLEPIKFDEMFVERMID